MPVVHTDIPNQHYRRIRDRYKENALIVDASSNQGDIDFKIMRSRGVVAGWFRVSVGDDFLDLKRGQYFRDAQAVGMPQGDYLVILPWIPAKKQMDFYYTNRPTGDKRPELPTVLDNEINKKSIRVKINRKKYEWQYKKVAAGEITERLLQCAEIIRKRDGRDPLHYTFADFLANRMEVTEEVKQLKLWYAHYRVNFPGQRSDGKNYLEMAGYGKGDWLMWQCLADGDDQGPYFGSGAHGLDISIYKGNAAKFRLDFGLGENSTPAPEPGPATDDDVIHIPTVRVCQDWLGKLIVPE